MAKNTTITIAPKIAGTTVIANGPPPGMMPTYSPSPQITSVAMYTAYSSTMNAISLQAATRGSIPARRSAHAVSAIPPAPAAANSLVAARPDIVIS